MDESKGVLRIESRYLYVIEMESFLSSLCTKPMVSFPPPEVAPPIFLILPPIWLRTSGSCA